MTTQQQTAIDTLAAAHRQAADAHRRRMIWQPVADYMRDASGDRAAMNRHEGLAYALESGQATQAAFEWPRCCRKG